MVGGRGVAAAGQLLARDAVRCAGAAGTADGSSAPGAAGPCRCDAGGGHRSAAGTGAKGAEPAAWFDAVYDVNGQLGTVVVASVRPGRCGHRQPGGQSWSFGDRRANWVLRQHAGAAGGTVWLADVGATAGIGEGTCPAGTGASGHSVRTGGGIGTAAAQPGACTVVPGDVRLAEHATGRVGSWRTRSQWSWHSADECAVRSGVVVGRKRGRDPRKFELCHGAVRAFDVGSLDRALAASVECDGGRGCRRSGSGPFATAERGRTVSGADAVECNGSRLSARCLCARTVRDAGGAGSIGHRTGARRGVADIRRIERTGESAGPLPVRIGPAPR